MPSCSEARTREWYGSPTLAGERGTHIDIEVLETGTLSDHVQHGSGRHITCKAQAYSFESTSNGIRTYFRWSRGQRRQQIVVDIQGAFEVDLANRWACLEQIDQAGRLQVAVTIGTSHFEYLKSGNGVRQILAALVSQSGALR